MENEKPTDPPSNQASSVPVQPTQPEASVPKDTVPPPTPETQTQATEMPNRPKKSKKLLFLLIALIVITLLGLAGYFAYQYYQLKSQIDKVQPTPVSDASIPTPPSDLDTTVDVETKQSTLKEVDNVWNLYTNYKLGFSIEIPKMVDYYIGGCEWDKDSEHYGNDMPSLSVKVFEDENGVFISHEYFAKWTRETTNDGLVNTSCIMIPTTLDELKKQRCTYHILVGKSENDEDLENFIKTRFGSACKIGERSNTKQEGVVDVRVQMDGKDFETSECVVNYIYQIKYDTNNNKVYTWDIGQEVTFQDNRYPELQDDMDSSFTVL